MEVVSPRCSGLDVHKRFVVACLSIIEGGQRHKEVRQERSMTSDILLLKQWLVEAGCQQIAMESTGVFWKPIYHLLEDAFEIVLVNAQHLKKVPGRKTDVKDAEWIADLLQHGLLKASFIPSCEQQAVRDLTRTRMRLIQERTRLINRIQKVLEDANIKLASVVSDLMGATGQAILKALVAGQEDPESLSHQARGSLVRKEEQLQAALQGKLAAHHRLQLEELLGLITTLDHSVARFDREIAERLRWFDALIERLDAVTGLSRRSVARVAWRAGLGYEPLAFRRSCGFLDRNLSGKRRIGRQTTQWPHVSRQSLGQIGPHPGGARGSSHPDLSGGAVPSDQRATREQESGHGGRPQYPGDFLPHGQKRGTLPRERS